MSIDGGDPDSRFHMSGLPASIKILSPCLRKGQPRLKWQLLANDTAINNNHLILGCLVDAGPLCSRMTIKRPCSSTTHAGMYRSAYHKGSLYEFGRPDGRTIVWQSGGLSIKNVHLADQARPVLTTISKQKQPKARQTIRIDRLC